MSPLTKTSTISNSLHDNGICSPFQLWRSKEVNIFSMTFHPVWTITGTGRYSRSIIRLAWSHTSAYGISTEIWRTKWRFSLNIRIHLVLDKYLCKDRQLWHFYLHTVATFMPLFASLLVWKCVYSLVKPNTNTKLKEEQTVGSSVNSEMIECSIATSNDMRYRKI